MLEIGKQYVFNTNGQDSEYKKYDNKVGTIIRPLKDGEEADTLVMDRRNEGSEDPPEM